MLICDVISLLNSLATLRSRRSCAFRSSAVSLRALSCFWNSSCVYGAFSSLNFWLDVGVGGHQSLALGALEHDLAVDQRAQHLQLLDFHLVVARVLAGRGELRFVLLFEIGVSDRASVHHRRHVGRRGASARACRKDNDSQKRSSHERQNYILQHARRCSANRWISFPSARCVFGSPRSQASAAIMNQNFLARESQRCD